MKRVIFTIVAFVVCIFCGRAQTNTFPATGNVGIGTLSPAANLQVIGSSRFGSADNYGAVDANGNLSFKGTAAYKVAGNKYAFQYSGDPDYGLFFNSTNVRYEFRNGTAVPIFYVDANNGNSVFSGTVKVGAYTLPATDGANGQVLKTTSSGLLTWSDDNNTIYSAGTGISLASNTITNTSPDQTVTLTGSGGSSVTGTYPNFTITSAIPTIYAAGTGINISGSTINSVWTQSGNNIFNNNTANIGIGVSTPLQKLDVNGNINIAKGSSLYIGNERTLSMETGTQFITTGNLSVGA